MTSVESAFGYSAGLVSVSPRCRKDLTSLSPYAKVVACLFSSSMHYLAS